MITAAKMIFMWHLLCQEGEAVLGCSFEDSGSGSFISCSVVGLRARHADVMWSAWDPHVSLNRRSASLPCACRPPADMTIANMARGVRRLVAFCLTQACCHTA